MWAVSWGRVSLFWRQGKTQGTAATHSRDGSVEAVDLGIVQGSGIWCACAWSQLSAVPLLHMFAACVQAVQLLWDRAGNA
jgi:hypothetical protein